MARASTAAFRRREVRRRGRRCRAPPRKACANQVREAVMNWVYWLSGAAAVGIFVYLIIALFKPEFFE
jgi:K+-transporting ATPase KdpF subunit